eukprot:12882980-Prorocentrum_lima.AAC.1
MHKEPGSRGPSAKATTTLQLKLAPVGLTTSPRWLRATMRPPQQVPFGQLRPLLCFSPSTLVGLLALARGLGRT